MLRGPPTEPIRNHKYQHKRRAQICEITILWVQIFASHTTASNKIAYTNTNIIVYVYTYIYYLYYVPTTSHNEKDDVIDDDYHITSQFGWTFATFLCECARNPFLLLYTHSLLTFAKHNFLTWFTHITCEILIQHCAVCMMNSICPTIQVRFGKCYGDMFSGILGRNLIGNSDVYMRDGSWMLYRKKTTSECAWFNNNIQVNMIHLWDNRITTRLALHLFLYRNIKETARPHQTAYGERRSVYAHDVMGLTKHNLIILPEPAQLNTLSARFRNASAGDGQWKCSLTI